MTEDQVRAVGPAFARYLSGVEGYFDPGAWNTCGQTAGDCSPTCPASRSSPRPWPRVPPSAPSPPNLTRAAFAGDKRDEIGLEFDQEVKWDNALAGQFHLDGQKGKVASGSVAGNVLTLKLGTATDAKTITYLDSAAWSQKALLVGANGLAAFTFCEVPLAPAGTNPSV